MIPAMIVPILTGPQLLVRMLGSLDVRVDHLVVVDNGGVVGEPVERAAYEVADRLSVIRMPANLGVAGSWNLGIKATPFAPWWLVVNHDVEFGRGTAGQFATIASPDTLVLTGGPQPWCCFAVGEDVVKDVGLFDEGFHPAYFEDTDYERRATAVGIGIVRLAGALRHDNSSTLASGYAARNAISYGSNAAYYGDKVATEDFSAGEWSLEHRRANSWD